MAGLGVLNTTSLPTAHAIVHTWRDDLRVVRRNTVEFLPARPRGPGGAGPSKYAQEYLTLCIEEGPDAAETASQGQELELLHETIRLLPERCRQVFALRRLQGLSHREIATRLGISENTVDAQLCNAIFRCRQYFLSHGRLQSRHALAPAGVKSP
jgi:RNA polymerase sigma factor (sigma-70 family)